MPGIFFQALHFIVGIMIAAASRTTDYVTRELDYQPGYIDGSIFIAALAVAGAFLLVVTILRRRLAHRRCCAQAKVEEIMHKVGLHDPLTSWHSTRVAQMALSVLCEMGVREPQARVIGAAALLHDVGKTEIPAAILTKPGPLTADEWKIVETHPDRGAHVLETYSLCPDVIRIVRHHHERWDGGGYPSGLKDMAIPLGARVLAVVDSFDAMITDRPYRHAIGLGEAIYTLIQGSGTQWDPAVVGAFLRTGLPAAEPELAFSIAVNMDATKIGA